LTVVDPEDADRTRPGALALTGERTAPGIPAENYWFRRHEIAYEQIGGLVDGARVLEVGSGEGYGTAFLAGRAKTIVGIDYDPAAVAHAAERYPRAAFVRGNLAALPVATAALDMVVSLQVIEHVWDHPQFVRECARVLRPDATLVMTTPNRLTFSPGLETPANPFHTKEFSASELAGLVTSCGLTVDYIGGVHPGPRLRELDGRYGSFVNAQLASAPQDWPDALRADVESVTTADFVVADNASRDVDESLDLMVIVRSAAR
jgi:SAM-dependent methyltransferase